MQVVTTPVLECSLEEFWNEYWSKQPSGVVRILEDASEAFRGESTINPRFRIRAPDGKGDVFFNNRELLYRFTSFPTPTQERFICSVRQALAENDVDQMVMTVPWSKSGRRKILIRSTVESTDFEVL